MHKKMLSHLLWLILCSNATAAEAPKPENAVSNTIGEQSNSQNSSLEAASNAANAAVAAANAAATAANAAANAASAAAQAASEAVKATAQSINQQNAERAARAAQSAPVAIAAPAPANAATTKEARPVVAMSAPTAKAPSATAPLNLKVDDSIFEPQTESLEPVNELSLSKLFGIRLLPVSVSREIHNEYLNVDDLGNSLVESPANIVPTLDIKAATKAAVDFSRDVRIADSRVNQANFQSNQARALLLPSLAVRYARGRENSSPSSVIDPQTGVAANESDHTRTDRAITFRQPLLDLPSIFDWKRRKEVINAREESRRGSQGDAWLSTVSAYLSLTSSRLISDLSQSYESQLNGLFDYVNKRASAGASSNSDRERVRARTLAASASRSQQESAHAAASVEFIRLTNLAPEQIKLPDREDLAAIPNTVGEAIKIAMANSPDVASVKAEMKAADIDRNVAYTRFSPRFDFELSKLSTTNAGGPVGLQEDTRAMLVMNWNLLAGGGDLQLSKEKRARLDEARYRLDDLQRRITQSMISQYASLDAIRNQLLSGYRELNAISSAANSMSEKMFAGNQSLLDLLDVYDRQYQARTRVVTLHIQEIDALSQIDRLLGQAGPSSSTIAEADMPATSNPARTGQLSPVTKPQPAAPSNKEPANALPEVFQPAAEPVQVQPLQDESDPIIATPLVNPAPPIAPRP